MRSENYGGGGGDDRVGTTAAVPGRRILKLVLYYAADESFLPRGKHWRILVVGLEDDGGAMLLRVHFSRLDNSQTSGCCCC